jgi:hypothetical protein
MNQIVARDFLAAWTLLGHEIAKAEKVENPQQVATEAERDALIRALIDVHYQCGCMGLRQSVELCNGFLEQLQNRAWHHERTARRAILEGSPRPPWPKEVPLPSFATIYAQLRTLAERTRADMDAIRLAVVFRDHAQYFEQDALLGAEFHNMASGKINIEMKAAGNCLAADLNTAAVFHLMRASELGLRRLARRLGAKLNYSLEFADWGKVIATCETRLKKLEPITRGKKKAADLEFYANAISDCRAFKETWRDCVMHARRMDFSFSEAAAVHDRVRSFILRLASIGLLK